MLVVRGNTTHFGVAYDSTLTNGAMLADAVLANCERDLAGLSALFGGIMPASLPAQVDLVPGLGGASHPSCADTHITCYISAGSDTLGVPAVVVAELAEVFMATQGLGWDCSHSHGEALSRVLATVLYPHLRSRFSVGNEWLNSGRPDWVSTTDPTDTHNVSTGCGTLFLNYLAYQLGFEWSDIIAAAAPTLALTAANLGVIGMAFLDFSRLVNRIAPRGRVAGLPDDDPFPVAAADQAFQAGATMSLSVGTEGANGFFKVPSYRRLVIEYASGRASLPAGQKGNFAIFTSLAGATREHWLLGSQALFGATVEPRAGEAVRLYADPGTLVTLRFDRDGATGTASASMSIAGRLIDL